MFRHQHRAEGTQLGADLNEISERASVVLLDPWVSTIPCEKLKGQASVNHQMLMANSLSRNKDCIVGLSFGLIGYVRAAAWQIWEYLQTQEGHRAIQKQGKLSQGFNQIKIIFPTQIFYLLYLNLNKVLCGFHSSNEVPTLYFQCKAFCGQYEIHSNSGLKDGEAKLDLLQLLIWFWCLPSKYPQVGSQLIKLHVRDYCPKRQLSQRHSDE